jgi:hypothetical protein
MLGSLGLMHYLYVGFMIAAGMTLFYSLLHNADIIWDATKLLLLLALPVLVLVVGALALVGIGFASNAIGQKVEEHRVQAAIHPEPPAHSAAVNVAIAAQTAPPTDLTPESVCWHETHLPLAKPDLYNDCVDMYRALLRSKKGSREVTLAAMSASYRATNKAQSLCIFHVLSDDQWRNVSPTSKVSGLESCLIDNRRYDSVR